MKQINVRLHHINSGDCIEVWQSEVLNGKQIYYGRGTHIEHDWSYLSDAPNGFCEKSHRVSNEVEFIVCDKNWNELLRDGNDKKRYPNSFPTLYELCIKEWNTIKEKYPRVTRNGFSKWIWAKSPQPLHGAEDLNWRDYYNRTTHTKVLHKFIYLGETYVIIRLSKQHTKCDAKWYEYFASRKAATKYESYAIFYGYEYGF
ncbi:MAG: hypothetical protein EZS26_001003 [Candidatus Ordinivivax streblomastigis]|uniref:Uncharacterized protein n=1 Tax=Candidatus Ordinivivax streblomastigis TaxID=2540710 RepID=A0A5M8P302_9BACT|nr:MAG: hypothetical protein EZS26_001003 [Candidatus Ordinivivax streblomastigis]